MHKRSANTRITAEMALRKILYSNEIIRFKITAYKIIVTPVVLYGSETWTLMK